MKIRRENPSQRLHHRVTAPVRIDTPDGCFKAYDWSLGGLGLETYTGTAVMGEQLDCTVHIPFQGFDVSFALTTEVVRKTDDGQLGLSFIDVGDREQEIMSHFVDDLVRGVMTSVDDVILRIDTPVTLVSTKPDPKQSSDAPVRRWPFKLVAFTIFYFTAGLAVVLYAALVFYTNFMRLEIDTGVVSAPVESILATSDGRIRRISFDLNRPIFQQAELIAIENASLQEEIDRAFVQIDRRTLELRARKKSLEAEKAKIADYRLIANVQIAQTQTRIKALQRQTGIAKRQADRFSNLHGQGYVTRSRLDDSASDHAELAGDLEEARQLMHQRRALLDRLEDGVFFNGNSFESRVHDLEVAVDLATDEIMLAKDELSALLRHRERLILTAPSDGHLIKLLKTVGSSVRRGEKIALFERDENRTIAAYLTQEEVLEIGLGDAATIYFPSLDDRVGAVVTAIDRTSGYIDEDNARYQWRGAKDRSARVTLSIVGLDQTIIRHRFAPGLPAVVIFSRRDTLEIRSRISNYIADFFGPADIPIPKVEKDPAV